MEKVDVKYTKSKKRKAMSAATACSRSAKRGKLAEFRTEIHKGQNLSHLNVKQQDPHWALESFEGQLQAGQSNVLKGQS